MKKALSDLTHMNETLRNEFKNSSEKESQLYYIVLHNFLYWLALNVGYRSATITKCRFILQDYLKENGFDLTSRVQF